MGLSTTDRILTSYEIDSPSKGLDLMADTALIVAKNLSHKDDGKDSFQKFTHLGQRIDDQGLSSVGLGVH